MVARESHRGKEVTIGCHIIIINIPRERFGDGFYLGPPTPRSRMHLGDILSLDSHQGTVLTYSTTSNVAKPAAITADVGKIIPVKISNRNRALTIHNTEETNYKKKRQKKLSLYKYYALRLDSLRQDLQILHNLLLDRVVNQ
ncbi:hypothetical protein CEXT_81641 [Caerostris extrusa]|uniref:Uncharacterized protein n=1 Tax=Caerostris extrusa TaxID=172846 RepID=A0AAV4MYR3_CAEEX|nr:hypothetical protein CEXT_81641 [Caerostris extrusa]